MADHMKKTPREMSRDAVRLEGMIIKGVGGFYYVECGDRVYECRARGVLRGGAGRERITPLAGDRCVISVHPDGLASVDSILERRNFLLRPPLANLDVLFIVVSLRDPQPNPLTVDRFISLAEYKGIEPVIVITKLDLMDDDGFPVQELYVHYLPAIYPDPNLTVNENAKQMMHLWCPKQESDLRLVLTKDVFYH